MIASWISVCKDVFQFRKTNGMWLDVEGLGAEDLDEGRCLTLATCELINDSVDHFSGNHDPPCVGVETIKRLCAFLCLDFEFCMMQMHESDHNADRLDRVYTGPQSEKRAIRGMRYGR